MTAENISLNLINFMLITGSYVSQMPEFQQQQQKTGRPI